MADVETERGPSLEKQLADILMNLSKGQPLSTPQMRNQVANEILTDLRSSFLNCTVLPYGLDEIGISDDSHSLYLSVDTYGKVNVEEKALHGNVTVNVAALLGIVQQVFKILTANSSSYHHVSTKSIPVHANYAFGTLMPTPLPEISFKHSRTNAQCKLRFENYFSVQRTRLLSLYSRMDVRFWPLLMVVRQWGSRFKVFQAADAIDFENYAICLLLVHFLILKKVIPSLRDLQTAKDSSVDKPFIVNNHDLSYCSNLTVLKPPSSANPALQDKEIRTLSIVSLLKGFFLYWATFNFEDNVICPILGTHFYRDHFWPKSDWKKLPDTLSILYLNGADGQPRQEKLDIKGPIILQDPFELTYNVTRNVSQDDMTNFREHSLKTIKMLDDVLNQSNSGGSQLKDIFR